MSAVLNVDANVSAICFMASLAHAEGRASLVEVLIDQAELLLWGATVAEITAVIGEVLERRRGVR